MKVHFDTNVILDVLFDREPFSEDASCLLAKVENAELVGFVCATTITTIYYLIAKSLGSQAASVHIKSLLSLFVVAPINQIVLENAAESEFSDFEDAVLHEAALHAGVKYIVTRNTKDFKKSKLSVFEPREFLNMLQSLENDS